MKRILVFGLSLAACAMSANATMIACSVITGGIVTAAGNVAKINMGGPLSSTAVFNCPGLDAGAGNILTNIQLEGTGDYDGGPFGTTSGTSVSEMFLASAGPFSPSTVNLIISGGNSSNGTNIMVPFQMGMTLNPGTQMLAGFLVNLSSNVTSGSVAESSAQMVLIYSTQSSGVTPEPATLGLMGSALLGLGFLARRKT